MNRGDVLRVLNQDDVIKMIRAYIQAQHDDCMTHLFDPQLTDINTITMLKGEIQAHKRYLDLFMAWEKEGRAALKKLHKEKNGSQE